MKISVQRLCDVDRMVRRDSPMAYAMVLCIDGEVLPGQISSNLEAIEPERACQFTVTFELLPGVFDLEV